MKTREALVALVVLVALAVLGACWDGQAGAGLGVLVFILGLALV